MGRLVDLTGKRFGKLLVVGRFGTNRFGQPQWTCKCDCGGTTVALGGNLKTGKTAGCGCSKGRPPLPDGMASAKQTYLGYKRGAIVRGLEFSLSFEDFLALTKQNCIYCGSQPKTIRKTPSLNGNHIYNGLDRVDNNLGYTMANVVPCCKRCNLGKSNISKEEFLEWIDSVYRYQHRL